MKAGVFIPNPCDYVMWEHMRYSGGTVTGISKAGSFTIGLLLLNDHEAVEYRQGLVTALNALTGQIAVARKTLHEAKKFAERAAPEDKGRAAAQCIRAAANLHRLQDAIPGLLGLAAPALH